MKKCLAKYSSPFEEALNLNLINKTADEPLVNYVLDSWKSLEVVPNIKFVGYEYTEKESDIDINKYIFKRDKKRKKKERYDYKYIDDSRFGKLTVHFEITLFEVDPKDGHKIKKIYKQSKSMLIPIQDEDGYYKIKGKKYYMIYQLLEKSTYTTKNGVTLKSLMPICVKRNVVTAEDICGKEYKLPYFNVLIFKKDQPILLFYLARGLESTLEFLKVDEFIHFESMEPIDLDEGSLYFPLSSKCYLVVDKHVFEKIPYVQSIVGGFIYCSTNRMTVEALDDTTMWIKKISGTNNYVKGLDILTFFNRLLDETTKKILKINGYHKKDIYHLLRWIMMDFDKLRMKDNMSLDNKRLRCNEYIASLLTKEFSKRLNRIISLGEKANIINYREFFKFPGEILIQQMQRSGILRFDDTVNDMTFHSKTKYTTKGPHALGGKNSNNISIRYRGQMMQAA